MNTPTLSLLSTHLAVAANKPAPVDFLVRLSAPEMDKADSSRPHVNLALVIDKSGSMAGEPLAQAKEAAKHLICRLGEGDQVCVVVYGNTVEMLAEPMDAVAGRSQLLATIDSIRSMGGTPLRSGWLLGAQALAPFVSKFPISRVLLLSDGQATDGSHPDVLCEEARELAQSGITTSTYGLGNHFNEDLMTQLAQGGLGQAFYAESAEALVPYFESEFAMLASTVGKKVRVRWAASVDGQPVGIKKLDTLAPANEASMQSLIADADSWVGARVDLPALEASKALKIEAVVRWEDMDGVEHELHQELSIPVRARSRMNKDEWAVERFKEVEAARIQREALENARQGNWEVADHLIRSMSASSGGNAYVAGVAENLSGLMAGRDLTRLAKEVAYSSHTMSTRIVDRNEQASSLESGRFGTRKARQGAAASVKSDESKAKRGA